MKPKPYKKENFSANEIKIFIKEKYHNDGEKFWDWFFSETSWGDDNLIQIIDPEFIQHKKYISFLEKEFKSYVDEEDCINIKNDF